MHDNMCNFLFRENNGALGLPIINKISLRNYSSILAEWSEVTWKVTR